MKQMNELGITGLAAAIVMMAFPLWLAIFALLAFSWYDAAVVAFLATMVLLYAAFKASDWKPQ